MFLLQSLRLLQSPIPSLPIKPGLGMHCVWSHQAVDTGSCPAAELREILTTTAITIFSCLQAVDTPTTSSSTIRTPRLQTKQRVGALIFSNILSAHLLPTITTMDISISLSPLTVRPRPAPSLVHSNSTGTTAQIKTDSGHSLMSHWRQVSTGSLALCAMASDRAGVILISMATSISLSVATTKAECATVSISTTVTMAPDNTHSQT